MVTWIYDGDTIEVDAAHGKIDVRLLDINAPDLGECYHEESRDYLIELLTGSIIRLETRHTDQFGRVLAHVWADGLHVNLDLVERGLAIATTPMESDPNGGAMVGAETAAYDTGVGLWAENACGAAGSVPAVVIAEGVVDPAGPDGEHLQDEYMEIANVGDEVVDLTAWTLRDESSRHRFRFSNDAFLQPGRSLMVTSADPGWDPGGGPVWNNSGDMALLLDRHGRVVARWRYQPSAESRMGIIFHS